MSVISSVVGASVVAHGLPVIAMTPAALDTSIASTSRIITDLLGSQHFNIELLRSAPAVVDLGNRITKVDSQEKPT